METTAKTVALEPVTWQLPLITRLLLLLVSDSVRPHRWQPTRLPRPWDSPGKNTGVGCHFLLQRMKVKSESEVAQSCPTPSDPKDCSLPASFIHGISRQEYWSGVPSPSLHNEARSIQLFPGYMSKESDKAKNRGFSI